jgi:carbamoyltransferase
MHKSIISPIDFLIEPPFGSILGINYSGLHDSAISIVTPEGMPVFAVSLERLSRVKQDGRTLHELLDAIPWERIYKVAISAPEYLPKKDGGKSKILSTLLPHPRLADTLAHGPGFYKAISRIPCEKVFVGHQEAHASSVFWGSGFEESLCLTYDGGMFNDLWFGGLYRCSKTDGITPLDRFDALLYAKVTTLYAFVTALLGFVPLRHEGKITGLAAYGKPTDRCRKLLKKWFEQDYFELETCLQYVNIYDDYAIPQLFPSSKKLISFRAQIEGISREELAATIQDFSEKHILQILSNARSLEWGSANICLAGGLFANVKINQKVVESGFDKLFVAPPMTDEGTALGAAWHVISGLDKFKPQSLHTMFLGPAYSEVDVLATVKKENIIFNVPEKPARTIAELLAQGSIVAVFQGAAEFGPRALGNRSILAQATEVGINQSLNERLNRTEFMPFAPMTRVEDAELCYNGIEHVRHAAEFMTVTVNCTEIMKKTCPAVVHVDGTARPQLVNAEANLFMHQVLTFYKKLTNNLAIVNTSFNVHEEPIVCSPEDALRGFFESGLDYLYMEGVGLISFANNTQVAIRYLQKKVKLQGQKTKSGTFLEQFLDSELTERTERYERVSKDLVERTQELVETRKLLIERTERLVQASKG